MAADPSPDLPISWEEARELVIVVLTAAAAMLLTRLPEPIGEALSLPKLVPLSSSELRELFIASFLCLYLLSIHRRARAREE